MLNLIFSILKLTNITKLVMRPAVQTSETEKMKGSYKLTKDRDSCDSSSVKYASKCPQTRKQIQLEKSRDKWKPQVSQKAHTVYIWQEGT